ncbi:MAG TPA: sulfotransferase domain-containing protein [Candidatus Babeliales bacterium]|nr:sulfotransferase domain-containing protein [Candidatus Babeliales bacterium]
MKDQIVSLAIAILLCASFSYSAFHQQILEISAPKTGTNLAKKCIQLLTNRKSIHNVPWRNWRGDEHFNKFYTIRTARDLEYMMHLPADKFWRLHLMHNERYATLFTQNNMTLFFIYRDPRDQIISFVFYYMKINKTTININDAITDLITKGTLYRLRPIANHNIYQLYQAYLPWMHHPNALAVRFEDLVGPNGGGPQDAQYKTVRAMAQHLQLDLSDKEIATVADSLFGSTLSHTFRKGQIGSWKEHFTDEHKQLFKEIAGQLLIDLGYESDMNW